MFKKVTRYVVSQMDTNKELAPVENSADQEYFRPSYLLIQKRKQDNIFRSDPYYQCTQFRLDDVLLPGKDSLLPSEDGSSQFDLSDITVDEVKGDISVSVDGASVELKGDGSLSQAFSIKLQKKAIPMDLLEVVRKNRKINMDHSFIQQLLRTGADLFLVSETLEASEKAIYKEDTKAELSFLAWIYAKFFAKGTTEHIESIIIPKGCTLAFRAIQMNISKGEWELSYFKGDPTSVTGVSFLEISTPKLDAVDRRVEKYCRIFSELPSHLRVMFLNTITAVMRDRKLFQELSQKMEAVLEKTDGYELKTESLDLKDLFSILEDYPRTRLMLANGIAYTLDALAELLDNQLALLLESLERKIVSQQLQLVGQLLEHNLKVDMPFHVDASLLSFPQEEDRTLTMALVELSRVKLQEDGLAVPMERPFEVVAALYVALYALSLLSGPQVGTWPCPGNPSPTYRRISAHEPLLPPSFILVNAQGCFDWEKEISGWQPHSGCERLDITVDFSGPH